MKSCWYGLAPAVALAFLLAVLALKYVFPTTFVAMYAALWWALGAIAGFVVFWLILCDYLGAGGR